MKHILTAAVAATCLSAPVFAAQDHWDRPSCYAYVHDQCFQNGKQLCDDATYDWALDECDGYYPSIAGDPPKRPLKLKAEVKPDSAVMLRVRASLKRKSLAPR